MGRLKYNNYLHNYLQAYIYGTCGYMSYGLINDIPNKTQDNITFELLLKKNNYSNITFDSWNQNKIEKC